MPEWASRDPNRARVIDARQGEASQMRASTGRSDVRKEGVVPRDWPYPISVFAGLDWGRLYSHSVSMAYTHSRLVTLRFFNGLFLVVLYQSLGSPVIPLKGTASATYLSVGPRPHVYFPFLIGESFSSLMMVTSPSFH